MNTLFFILGTIGASFILADGKILEPVRNYVKKWSLIHTWMTCYTCNSFWIGLFLGYFIISKNLYLTLACGFSGSFATTLAVYLTNILELIAMRNQIAVPQSAPCKHCQSNPTNIPSTPAQ